jgi:TRAP-type C4-dicarboxylate transport system substrate-binding protein
MKRLAALLIAAPLAAGLVAFGLAGCTPATPANVTVLTYASPYGPAHPFSRADAAWMQWVAGRSQGSLRIQAYWSGGVLSAEHSMTELRHGVVDIGLITPIYARGGTHLIRAQAAFYGGLTTFGQQVALYRCMQRHDAQFDRELAGLVVLAVQGGNLPGILTRNRRVESLADLAGLRLRAPAELLAVLEHFGADPVEMPMGEVYSALAKGVLDGVVAPRDTLRSLHFAEVAKYFYALDIPRGAYAARAIGEQRWLALSEAHRAILAEGAAVWEQALESQLLAAEHAGETLGREHGVVYTRPAPADVAAFLAGYDEFAKRGAGLLDRFGIDGLATYRYARAVVASGKLQECNGEAS